VLEIGTGSGYQATVLSNIVSKVYTVERHKSLYLRTKKLFEDMKLLGRIEPRFADGSAAGLSNERLFDRVLVTAGAPYIPESLLHVLKPNGILVIPVGDSDKQKMMKIIKTEDGGFIEEEYDGFRFVPLIGKNAWKS
jgi:protein-L-isoaspartate(D-aspartate) O-methyltransferase